MADVPVLEPRLIVAPYYVGFVAEIFLTGIAGALFVRYFLGYGLRDKWQNLVAVLITYTSCILLVFANIALLWTQLVDREDLQDFISINWQTKMVISTTMLTIFFCYRLAAISQKPWLPIPIALISITAAVLQIVTVAYGDSLPPLAGRDTAPGIPSLLGWSEISLWLDFGADLLTVIAMVYFLLRIRTGFSAQTDYVLTRIMKLALVSAAITLPVPFASVIVLRATMGVQTTATTALGLALPPLYVICVLTNLILRKHTIEHAAKRAHTSPLTMSGDSSRGRAASNRSEQQTSNIILPNHEVEATDEKRAQAAFGYPPQTTPHEEKGLF